LVYHAHISVSCQFPADTCDTFAGRREVERVAGKRVSNVLPVAFVVYT